VSPLIFNIALTALDEHVMGAWKAGGAMATDGRRTARRRRGLPNWRIARYADLCRRRHKSAYAEARVMPIMKEESLVGAVNLLTGSA